MKERWEKICKVGLAQEDPLENIPYSGVYSSKADALHLHARAQENERQSQGRGGK